MADFPRSLPEFERRFPDEAACAEWLLERRWGSGFACPECGHDECWRLGRKVLTLQCKACRRETSVTAGTVMHRSHLPLKVWFTAAWLVATHRNGMSARQLWLQLGLGSYKSAWLLLRKLRAAMVDPDRSPLAGLVEVDETSLPFRGGGEPARPGRSRDGKLLLAGAVEIKGRGPGRTRLAVIGDYSAASLGGFVGANVAEGSTVVSDGWSGYKKLKDVKHDPKVVGDTPAHLVLPWVHRVFANAKRWALGIYHGLREEHLQAYLDEFVFRFNRRRTPQAAFARLLGLAVTIGPHPYDALVASGSRGKAPPAETPRSTATPFARRWPHAARRRGGRAPARPPRPAGATARLARTRRRNDGRHGGSMIPKTMRVGAIRTSLRLEPEFWGYLKEVAQARGLRLTALVNEVAEATPDRASLASALRVFALLHARRVASGAAPGKAEGERALAEARAP